MSGAGRARNGEGNTKTSNTKATTYLIREERVSLRRVDPGLVYEEEFLLKRLTILVIEEEERCLL